ncbi:MAG: hypothetical protein WCP12_06475 [bacterium]
MSNFFQMASRKLGRIGVLACTQRRMLMLVRKLPDQRTGGDAYSPSKASNPIIPTFQHSRV